MSAKIIKLSNQKAPSRTLILIIGETINIYASRYASARMLIDKNRSGNLISAACAIENSAGLMAYSGKSRM